MRKRILTTFIMILVIIMGLSLVACGPQYKHDNTDKWKTKFDITIPNLKDAGISQDTANNDGWYMTLNDDFDNGLGENWGPVESKKRKYEYWCDNMISTSDGLVHIDAKKIDHHTPDKCGGESGYFTSGIITCDTSSGSRVPIFEQAFGYFECKVKIPNSGGMWSAFWLQTNSIRNKGNKGMDGSEIDVFESVFYEEKTEVASAIIYDGYKEDTRSLGKISDVGTDTYDGFHTYALKWTPNEYVFYFDGKPTWATNYGGICRVPAFLMLTCEIREEGTGGPHGERLGEFTGGEFLIDYVRVYQNIEYLPHIKSLDDFK